MLILPSFNTERGLAEKSEYIAGWLLLPVILIRDNSLALPDNEADGIKVPDLAISLNNTLTLPILL